jgi:hypothetical protein
LFDARRGVYHYWDGSYQLPGLLADQAFVLRALVDALQYAVRRRSAADGAKTRTKRTRATARAGGTPA